MKISHKKWQTSQKGEQLVKKLKKNQQTSEKSHKKCKK